MFPFLELKASSLIMATWDITGVWIGEYSYLPSEGYSVLPPTTKFTLDVSRGCLGRFRGTAQDHLIEGGLGEATIVGRAAKTRVNFLKQYLVCHVTLRGQSISLREHLESEHGVLMDNDVRPDPIRYTGVYDPDRQVVSGSWLIRSGRIRFLSQGKPLQLEFPTVTGNWTMHRQW